MTPFIRRVILKNYKSIAGCDVWLPPLGFLVGRNGAGKSNFLDALRLISDALNTSLDHAFRDRNGIHEVRRRSSGHPTHFGIRVEFRMPDQSYGFYAFHVGAQMKGGYDVQQEECRIFENVALDRKPVYYVVRSGKVTDSSLPAPPAARHDRLYLGNVSDVDDFRPLYDSLSRMVFYHLNPDVIRAEQSPDVGLLLKRDGRNLAGVLERLETCAPDVKRSVETFLAKIAPDIKGVATRNVLSKETIEFRQSTRESTEPWRFLAASMSEGTLRALGILVAVFQNAAMKDPAIPLIGIEDPETALHPAAAGTLRDALRFAAKHTQVLATSHSPDLLDDPHLDDESILSVVNEDGETSISRMDAVPRAAIRDALYATGEPRHTERLTAEPPPKYQQRAIQRELFSNTVDGTR